MPFVKPETLLALQRAAVVGMQQQTLDDDVDSDKANAGVNMCIVCGNPACSKTVVAANGVYVHREDVIDAEPIRVSRD